MKNLIKNFFGRSIEDQTKKKEWNYLLQLTSM